MLAFKYILLFIFQVSAALLPTRQTCNPVTALQALEKDCKALATAVQNYDGSAGSAQAVFNAAQQFDNDIKALTVCINNTKALTQEQCDALFKYLSANIEPCLKNLVKLLISQRDLFKKFGHYDQIKKYIRVLASDTLALVDAICAKCPRNSCKDIRTLIANDYQTAIDAYP